MASLNDVCSTALFFSTNKMLSLLSQERAQLAEQCRARQDFLCPDDTGQCIGRARLCDGHSDCADGADERDCGDGQPTVMLLSLPHHSSTSVTAFLSLASLLPFS